MARIRTHLIFGDVVNSRGITDRKSFRSRLTTTLKHLVADRSDDWTHPVQCWKGIDEIAGFIRPQAVYRVVDAIRADMAPDRIRFVLVSGEMDRPRPNQPISELDGELFHLAASGMIALKKEGFPFKWVGPNDLRGIENQINLLQLIKDEWSVHQRALDRMKRGGSSQQEIARTLGITRQSVSKSLAAIRSGSIHLLEERLQNQLDERK